MKYRGGFVSNSSSSSFVFVATKEAYDDVMSKEDPLTQAILSAVMTSDKVFGRDCMIYEDCSSDYWWDELDYDGIIKNAKEIAEKTGRPVVAVSEYHKNADTYTDDDYRDIIIDCHDASEYFDATHETWSHRMDW